ncbi:unnamed protein product [Closterium sp. NIES-53]
MENWSGKKPLVDMLRVFGCMGLVHVPKERRDKLQAAAVWTVHLGLARGSKGWLMWDPKSNTIFTTRDAKFMEGLMFKEWSEQGRNKVTIPLGIEGRPIQFDTWLDDMQLYLLSDSRDIVSLFGHTYGAAPALPPQLTMRLAHSKTSVVAVGAARGTPRTPSMADSTASDTIVTRADICGAITTSSLMDGLLLKAKRVEEQEEGEEEAVEAVAVAEVVLQEPEAVGKVTLHSLDYWVINSGATYGMTPRADLLTELEPSLVKHVTSALGQRAEVKEMGKAMFKGTDGKMVGLKNVLWVPNLAANLISVRRLQKAGMDTSSEGAKTYTARLGERILRDLHKDRDV